MREEEAKKKINALFFSEESVYMHALEVYGIKRDERTVDFDPREFTVEELKEIFQWQDRIERLNN